MKREGRKIVGVVVWDYQIARIAERAGADLVSVGDSVGVNLWGQAPDEITVEEMLVVCKAVRRGVKRALLSCDLPPRRQSLDAALRLRDAGADMVKVPGEEATREIVRAGIPVFAEMHGGNAATGGLGGGPWLDGRMRMALAAIGYLDSPTEQYANVAKVAFDALSAYAEDVRNGKQIRGQRA